MRNSVLFSNTKIRIHEILENGFKSLSKKKMERVKEDSVCEDLRNFEKRYIYIYKIRLIYWLYGQISGTSLGSMREQPDVQ